MASIGFYFRALNSQATNAMRQRLNAIAAHHGYVSHGGPTTGEGNTAAMLIGIDSGELATVMLADEERGSVIAWLYRQADELSIRDFLLAESVRSLAKQLQMAARREVEMEAAELRSYLEMKETYE